MKQLRNALIILGIMWIIFIIFGQKAIPWGILPRHFSSLKGILFAPFIHANLLHIISNTIPIFVLTWLVALRYKNNWLLIWMLISIMADTLLWIFGRPAYHVGASITIFGLIGFFLASGLFRKKILDFFIALGVGVLYGGALLGMLPTNPAVSWEGHLFGFISGIFMAYWFRNSEKETKKSDDVLPQV